MSNRPPKSDANLLGKRLENDVVAFTFELWRKWLYHQQKLANPSTRLESDEEIDAVLDSIVQFVSVKEPKEATVSIRPGPLREGGGEGFRLWMDILQRKKSPYSEYRKEHNIPEARAMKLAGQIFAWTSLDGRSQFPKFRDFYIVALGVMYAARAKNLEHAPSINKIFMDYLANNFPGYKKVALHLDFERFKVPHSAFPLLAKDAGVKVGPNANRDRSGSQPQPPRPQVGRSCGASSASVRITHRAPQPEGQGQARAAFPLLARSIAKKIESSRSHCQFRPQMERSPSSTASAVTAPPFRSQGPKNKRAVRKSKIDTWYKRIQKLNRKHEDLQEEKHAKEEAAEEALRLAEKKLQDYMDVKKEYDIVHNDWKKKAETSLPNEDTMSVVSLYTEDEEDEDGVQVDKVDKALLDLFAIKKPKLFLTMK